MKKSDRKEVRRREAIERNEAWASLTPEEQLAHLDKHNLRAKRQRARLASLE